MDDSRLVRDLLEANLVLTAQVVELARIAIGAPQVVTVEGAPMAVEESLTLQDFRMSTDDDWEDIPAEPPLAQVYEFPQVERNKALPIHMSEEEEDLRHRVGAGIEAPQALTDLLRRLEAPGVHIEIKPNA